MRDEKGPLPGTEAARLQSNVSFFGLKTSRPPSIPRLNWYLPSSSDKKWDGLSTQSASGFRCSRCNTAQVRWISLLFLPYLCTKSVNLFNASGNDKSLVLQSQSVSADGIGELNKRGWNCDERSLHNCPGNKPQSDPHLLGSFFIPADQSCVHCFALRS